MSKTYEEVLADLRAIVQGREDYVYEPAFTDGETNFEYGVTCTYTTQDGKPSCVVGHVIAVEFPDLLPTIREMEWRGVEASEAHEYLVEPLTEGVTSLTDSYRDTIDWDDKARYLLLTMQTGQDRGTPWGEALTQAIRVTEEDYGA